MFKCQICGKKFNELPSLYNHLESKHKEMIPKDMSVQQYYYFMKTGKRNGNCVMCKKPTTWNKNTNKYNRFCGDPKCKDEYVKIVKGRMVAKYGKVHLLNDPNKQREMLANRSISGKYTWSNSTVETTYTGSYELDFLKMLDLFFEWDPVDISMPSPHTYTYEYQGEQKFYIPDAFIHSLGLEIEIKDGGDNPNNHHKIQAVDKEKERLKDEVMTSQKMFHYVKITNKNYSNFFDFLKEIKEEYGKHDNEKDIKRIFKIEDIKTKSKPVNESYEIIEEGNVFEDIILKLRRRSLEENRAFINMAYNVKKDNPKEMKKYIMKMGKEFNYRKDLLVIKDIVDTTEKYYKQKAKENPEFKKEYFDFVKWYDKKLRWEIEYRLKHIKESTEYVEENLLVSKDNLEFNLENFNQNNNILFITGLGGSGKSTIISEYATKYNAQPLEYDAVTSALIKGLENLNRNKIHPIILEYLEKENPRRLNGFSDPNFNKECVKFLNWFEANYSNDGNLYVLEGMQIFLCFNPERFKDKPIVIMGTSVTKSMFRSVSRTYKRSHGDIIRTFKFFLKTIKRFPIFVKNDKRIDELIDTIQESYDDIYEDYIHESSISISHINKCLQQDTDRLLKEYLQDYTDFYHRMMKEQPASIPHINEDIKKAILAIDDLSKKENVNNDLLKSAKWCLGDLVNLNKNSSPIKHSKYTQSLVEGYHKIITPGSTIWVGADWHFYTGYNDQLKENPNIDRLVNNFNAKVKDTDVVIFIGDLYDARRLFDLNKLPKLDRIKKLKGYKIIVKGNHDVADDDIYYKMGFDEVCERYEVGNVIFTHEPCEVKANQVNVHGHLHYSKSYWYIKPSSHIDAYTARFDYQPMLVEDVVLNYNDGFLKPQAMDKFIKTFHVNKSSVKECYEPEYNELINGIRIKLVTESLNKRSFGIMDKNTRIIINDKYTIQRDNGLKCSVRPVIEGYENKEVMEFEIKYNSNIDIEQLINETLDIGLTIGGLYIPTDKENKLIQEVCLKLFGSYPDKCNFYK